MPYQSPKASNIYHSSSLYGSATPSLRPPSGLRLYALRSSVVSPRPNCLLGSLKMLAQAAHDSFLVPKRSKRVVFALETPSEFVGVVGDDSIDANVQKVFEKVLAAAQSQSYILDPSKGHSLWSPRLDLQTKVVGCVHHRVVGKRHKAR